MDDAFDIVVGVVDGDVTMAAVVTVAAVDVVPAARSLEETIAISLVVDRVDVGVIVIPIILLDRNILYYDIHADTF